MTTITSIFSDEILVQAAAARDAENQYESQFNVWADSVTPLAPEHFWPEVAKLREIWAESDYDAERAADEYLRQAKCESEDRFAAAVHFAVSYGKYVHQLHKACVNIYSGWERGDDSYSDLMDSLPMAGQDVHGKVISGEYFDDDEVEIDDLEEAVKQTVGLGCANKILHGEHYMASSLEAKARDRMKFVLTSRKDR